MTLFARHCSFPLRVEEEPSLQETAPGYGWLGRTCAVLDHRSARRLQLSLLTAHHIHHSTCLLCWRVVSEILLKNKSPLTQERSHQSGPSLFVFHNAADFFHRSTHIINTQIMSGGWFTALRSHHRPQACGGTAVKQSSCAASALTPSSTWWGSSVNLMHHKAQNNHFLYSLGKTKTEFLSPRQGGWFLSGLQ